MFHEEIEDMDTTDTPWHWHYLADCGRWHRLEDDPYNPLSSKDIERYYQENSKGVLSTVSSNCNTKIDFAAMLQTDLSTGRQRRVHRGYNIGRSCSCFNESPVFWERVDPTWPYQLIPLSELTPEYQCVESYVKNEGLLDRSIISICRIQNLDLWDIFCSKKKQLMRIKGIKEIQERRLFHGTEIKNVDSICKNNFDLRLAGLHAHVYGKGIYFARHASHADKYSRSSTHPLNTYGGETQGVSSEPRKIIFLARVMIGKSVVGQDHFQKPDHGSSENIHDSCVNDVNHPTIFVIFDPNQIYPEYLIQYK
uniref:protein mono-ADP-ribosyltransferase PARP11-like n=1 Tax=Scatophagus argus TaxID=75038 RepID=UPI001ED8109C|nr:protein mono-ADP-ribosyltransferase PARP11-like [Scatophagus argus]